MYHLSCHALVLLPFHPGPPYKLPPLLSLSTVEYIAVFCSSNSNSSSSNHSSSSSFLSSLPHLSSTCRRHVTDMSPTCAYVAKSWPTLRVVATQKRPRHTQFISIITDKCKSAQTYRYLSYHRVFVFELKQQSRNYRHVGIPRHVVNVVSFWTPCRHDIFLCMRHD